MSTWRKVGYCLIAAVAAFVARAEAPNTQWTWTKLNSTMVTLTEVTPEGYDPETYVPWKFNLTSAGVLSIATTVDTTGLTSPKINFRTIPEDCPYEIKSLAGKCFMAKSTSYSSTQSTAAATIIEEVYLPASLTTFNMYNFYQCAKLKICDLPPDNQVATIANDAFMGCTSLQEYCLGPKVTTINGSANNGAFNGCSHLVFTGLMVPDTLTTIQNQAFRGASSTLLSGRVVFGGDDSHDVSFGSYAFCSQPSITELVFGAKVTNCGTSKGSATTPFAQCTGVTNFVSRNPDGFTFGSTTDSYLFNLNGLKQYDLAGWPKGKMVANVTNGKQTRILAPCDNLKWLGYVAESSRVTPWGNVTAANQNAYWTYFYGDLEAAKAAAAAGEIPTPVGRVASAAFYEGASIPVNVWIVFDKGEEIDARTLIIAGDLDGLVPTTDEAEFLPPFGQTNFLAKTDGGESVSLVCTAPRFARVTPTAETTNYCEVAGWRILARDANGAYTTVVDEGRFDGDAPRQVAFDTAVLTGTNYKLVWRTSPLTAGEFAFVPRLISNQTFTGSAIEPSVGVETVVVADDRVTLVTLVAGKEYSISYLDNTKIGTGRVIATGSGDYEGVAATNEFAIVSPDLGGMTLSGDFSDRHIPETEQAVIDDLRLVDGSGQAVDPAAYEVRYIGNGETGVATAYAVGKAGDLAGRVISARTFNVVAYPVYRVTGAVTDEGDGRSWQSPMSYTNALAALAATGGEIWIAGTVELTSSPASRSFTKPLGVIRGGFAGTEAKSSERAAGAVAVIDGMGDYNPLQFTNATKFELEDLVFTRGYDYGFHRSGGAGDLVIRRCRSVANCGKGRLGYTGTNQYREADGGGGARLVGNGQNAVTIVECDFSANTIKDCNDYANGCGVMIKNFGSAVVEGCTFTNNFTGSYGIRNGGTGMGAYAYNTKSVCFTNCVFKDNQAVSIECSTIGVVGADSASVVGCVLAGNLNGSSNYSDSLHYGTIYVSMAEASSPFVIESSTIAYNLSLRRSAIWVSKGLLAMTNSIVAGNVSATTSACGVDLAVSENGSAKVGYTLFSGEGTDYVSSAADTVELANVIYGDPRLVTSVEDFIKTSRIDAIPRCKANITSASLGRNNRVNVHLRGGSGYLDELTGETVTAYRRKGSSPAIDTGDPASEWANEPSPNGRRVNLGAYGNTPWATMSPAGLMLLVR